jgi:hypothetical protein
MRCDAFPMSATRIFSDVVMPERLFSTFSKLSFGAASPSSFRSTTFGFSRSRCSSVAISSRSALSA